MQLVHYTRWSAVLTMVVATALCAPAQATGHSAFQLALNKTHEMTSFFMQGIASVWASVVDVGSDARNSSAPAGLANNFTESANSTAVSTDLFKETLSEVVRKAGELRAEPSAMADAHGDGLQLVSDGLDALFMALLEELQDEFPPLETAPSHAERRASVSRVMERAEEAMVRFCADRGMPAEGVKSQLDGLFPHMEKLVVMMGDLAEQHPVLLENLLLSGAVMLIPETWILRPLLRLFGFGSSGPVKGSAAAWAQRVFFGAVVKEDAWFSFLQRAGMKPAMRGSIGKSILDGLAAGARLVGNLFARNGGA
ncbi:hypothetical protein AcW1_006384 [Taiwanofungus camphoratus]|nr:hypothetical protein AcW1_006384 [Antrodia cinnamomea]